MSKYAEIQAKISQLQKEADHIYASEKKSAIGQVRIQRQLSWPVQRQLAWPVDAV